MQPEYARDAARTEHLRRRDRFTYDVANECIANTDKLFNVNGGAREPGDDKKESGKSAWVQIYKDNHYVEKAFQIAKKYKPDGCALCYNDYNEYWDGKGDINKDKALDLADTVLLQKWLLAYPDAAPEDWESGDMDQNGLLNAADLSLMKQALLAQ